MVDLAIASNFARELTEEQFAERRRTSRRRAAAEAADRPTARAEAAARPAAQAPTRSALARLMSRLVQVRG